MRIEEILSQSGNDFSAVLQCEHCLKYQSLENGYHDDRYHLRVIPAIICVSCSRRGNEIIPEGIRDPGTSAGFPVKKEEVKVLRWVRA